MPQSRKHIFILLFSLLTISWSQSTKAATASCQSEDSVVVSILGSGYSSVTYKGAMDVFNKHFSGLYFFKQTEVHKKRMVVLSEFGLSLLDFEFTDGTACLMNAQDFLNRPGLIELMKDDFGFLVNGIKFSEVLRIKHKSAKNGVQRQVVKTDKGRFTLHHRVTDNQLLAVKRKKGWFTSVKYSFSYEQDQLPEEISIQHTGLPFKMKLKKIN